MNFQPKKFLKNSSVALAMVMATIGLKIPIRPIPRQNPELVDVESFDISSEIAHQITNQLALYGPSFPENAKKVESAIRLDDPVFVASFDTLLKGHACNLSTEQVLEYISIALHPTPKSHGTTAPIKLSEVLKRDLRQFKVFHERHNLFAHVRAMAEGMGLHHRHSN